MKDTCDIIERFLKYTEDRDFDGHREILAEDCVFIYPYAAEGAPERIEGRDTIIERTLVGGWKLPRPHLASASPPKQAQRSKR